MTLQVIRFIYYYLLMENCRRCWEKLNKKSDLWCSKCKKDVDQEMRGEISRPRAYYMSFYLRYKNKWQHTLTVQSVEKE